MEETVILAVSLLGVFYALVERARRLRTARDCSVAWRAIDDRTIALERVQADVARERAAVEYKARRLKPQEDLEEEVQRARDRLDEMRFGAVGRDTPIANAARALLLDSKVLSSIWESTAPSVQYAPAERWEALAQELAKLGLWPPTMPDAAEAKGEETVQ